MQQGMKIQDVTHPLLGIPLYIIEISFKVAAFLFKRLNSEILKCKIVNLIKTKTHSVQCIEVFFYILKVPCWNKVTVLRQNEKKKNN